MLTKQSPPNPGDAVIVSVGHSRVYGTLVRYDHGGLSVLVEVHGNEGHHTWFSTPPWWVQTCPDCCAAYLPDVHCADHCTSTAGQPVIPAKKEATR